MKLVDIILERKAAYTKGTRFIVDPKSHDPEKGVYAYKVEYSAASSVQSSVDKLYRDLKDLTKQFPDDSFIEAYYRGYNQWKKEFRSYMTRKYPDHEEVSFLPDEEHEKGKD